jgi:hypothetical protein
MATSIGGASAARPNAAGAVSESGTRSTSSTVPSGGASGAPTLAGANGEAANASSLNVPVGGARRSGTGPVGSPSGSGSGNRASSSNTSTFPPAAASSGVSRNGAGATGSVWTGSSWTGGRDGVGATCGSANAGAANVGSANAAAGAGAGSGTGGARGATGCGSGTGADAAAIAFGFPRPPGGATIIARSRSASSGETWSTSCSFCSTVEGVPPSATAMASSSRSFTGMRLPGGSAWSLWSVPRYGVMPGSSWLRRSWATVSPMLVAGSAATASSRDVVLGTSSATSTPHDPASTHRSLSGMGTLPRSYATSSRRLRPAPRATSDSESPFLRRTDRRCFPSCFGVTVSSVVDASDMPLRIGGRPARL